MNMYLLLPRITLVKGGGKKADSNHSIRVFIRLILCGKLREAIRWITGRASGGVLDVNAVDAKSGMTVLECLKEKHPEPSQIDEKAFLACDVLPPLIEIDIKVELVLVVSVPCYGKVSFLDMASIVHT